MFAELREELFGQFGLWFVYYYWRTAEGKGRIEAVYYILSSYAEMFAKQAIGGMICRFLDHDFEDHGYAGPESGCIDVECKRCGYGFREWLY